MPGVVDFRYQSGEFFSLGTNCLLDINRIVTNYTLGAKIYGSPQRRDFELINQPNAERILDFGSSETYLDYSVPTGN